MTAEESGVVCATPRRSTGYALLAAIALAAAAPGCSGCGSSARVTVRVERERPPPPSELLDGAGNFAVAAPRGVRNVTLFPVLAKQQAALGAMTTLAAAVRAGEAEVREARSDDTAPIDDDDDDPFDSPVMIANRGVVPIVVLAGTVLRGGEQDRLIPQDLVVAARSTVSVDALCVEEDRGTATRDGVPTEGKFEAPGLLAPLAVRAAGQYAHDQDAVWARVAELKEASHAESDSASIFVALDDPALRGRVAALTAEARAALAAAPEAERQVGFAYAVGGKLRGVRWFANRDAYGLFRDALLEAAALDALTAAPPERGVEGGRAPPLTEVASRVRSVDAAPAVARATHAANVDTYKTGGSGAGSALRLAAAGTAPLSSDYAF